MRKLISTLLLAVIAALGLVTPVWAAETKSPEISITWLSVEGQPNLYNRTMGWLTINTGEKITISEDSWVTVTCLVDCATGKKVDDFDFVGGLSEGLLPVGKWEGRSRKFGFINKDKDVVIPLEYTWADSFSEGLAEVGVGDWGSTKYVYINKKGEIVVQPEYDRAYAFSDGVALVAKENEYGNLKWGLIDKTGKIITPLEYEEIASSWSSADFSEQLVRAAKINEDGETKYCLIQVSERQELSAAQCRQYPGGNHPNGAFYGCLVLGAAGPSGKNGGAVMLRHLLIRFVEHRFGSGVPEHAGLEIVRRENPCDTAKVPIRIDMAGDPRLLLHVQKGLCIGVAAVRQHGDEQVGILDNLPKRKGRCVV